MQQGESPCIKLYFPRSLQPSKMCWAILPVLFDMLQGRQVSVSSQLEVSAEQANLSPFMIAVKKAVPFGTHVLAAQWPIRIGL